MTNPFQEFLQEYGSPTKEAGFNPAASEFGKALLGGFGAAAATAVIGGAGMAASKLMDAATKQRDFRRMLSFNPDLQEHHERDPRMFNQMYSSLRTMNPGFAKDPLVAGTYMRRMNESPLTAGGVLTDAVGARDKLPTFLHRATDKGVDAASSFLAANAKKPVLEPDPLSDLRRQTEEARMRGELDQQRLMQQRRDQIRRLRNITP